MYTHDEVAQRHIDLLTQELKKKDAEISRLSDEAKAAKEELLNTTSRIANRAVLLEQGFLDRGFFKFSVQISRFDLDAFSGERMDIVDMHLGQMRHRIEESLNQPLWEDSDAL